MTWWHAVVDVDAEHEDAAAAFWSSALGWPPGDPWPDDPACRSFEPLVGDAYVHLQRLGAGPARVHLDLEVDDVDVENDRLVALRAVAVDRLAGCRSLRSPGGLPFCLVPRAERQPPAPVEWPDGHRSRLVQVCIDCPEDTVEAEVAFWRAALRSRWVPSGASQFLGKVHDDAGSPVQLLFQRLDESTGPVRAHLDLGTDDLAAEVTRLTALGATPIFASQGYVALRDPAGLAFCATRNSPEQTRGRDLG